MPRRIDLTGQKLCKLTAIKDVGKDQWGNRLWKCKCECGGTINARAAYLTKKITKHCGCVPKPGNHVLPKGEAAFNTMYDLYKRRAKKRDYEFNLTKDEFKELTSQYYFYCGQPPTDNWKIRERLNGGYPHNGVDRIDNSIGYVTGNCVPCCAFCNRAKDILTQEEFLDHIQKIYEHAVLKSNVVV